MIACEVLWSLLTFTISGNLINAEQEFKILEHIFRSGMARDSSIREVVQKLIYQLRLSNQSLLTL